MKVIVCTVMPIPHIGGASTHINLLISSLNRNVENVVLLNGNDLKPSNFDNMKYFFKRILFKDQARVSKLLSSVEQMTKQIRIAANTINSGLVIHCHDPLATCAAVHAAIPGASIVQTVHGPWSKENQADGNRGESLYNAEIYKIEQKAYSYANILIPVDEGQANILLSDFGVEAQRIVVVENAVDVESLSNSVSVLSEQYPIPFFLVPRRLVPKNGVEFAIRAFAQLERDDINLFIAGDGLLKGSLSRLAKDLGVSSNVKFLGDVSYDKIIPLIKQSKAVIVPSVPANGVIEATSLAVLEAIACSVPVIGSAIGGIKDIICDENFGFLVEPGNPDSISLAMMKTLEMNSMERSRLTQNAKKRIEENYGVIAWRDRIIAVYRESISRVMLTNE